VTRFFGAPVEGSSPDDASVLQPDVTFAAAPILHALHGYLFFVCIAIAAVSFFIVLPVKLTADHESWACVFLPLIFYAFGSMAFHSYFIFARKRCVRMQLGPAPEPEVTIAAASMQWDVLHKCFISQHVASNAADIVLLIGIVASEVILYGRVSNGKSAGWRTAVLPVAVAGLISLCIHTLYRLRCACVMLSHFNMRRCIGAEVYRQASAHAPVGRIRTWACQLTSSQGLAERATHIMQLHCNASQKERAVHTHFHTKPDAHLVAGICAGVEQRCPPWARELTSSSSLHTWQPTSSTRAPICRGGCARAASTCW
jgi:hypothetical protein